MFKPYCPNCKTIINREDWNSFGYGSPIFTCPKCNKEFLDKRVHEPAIEGIGTDINKINISLNLKIALLSTTIWITCWYAVTIVPYKFKFPCYMCGSFLLLIALLSWMTVIRIKSGKEAKILLKLVQESEKRLQDESYARRLYNLGYKVPEKYLPKDLQ